MKNGRENEKKKTRHKEIIRNEAKRHEQMNRKKESS